MRFVVINDYTNAHCEVDAESHEEALDHAVPQSERDKCLGPALYQILPRHPITGAKSWVDEGTLEGWGEGWKFAGQQPKRQIIVTIFPIK